MGGINLMRMGTIGGLSRAPSSEVLTKAMVALGEAAKKFAEKPWEIVLLPVDNAKETNLAFSGIVFITRAADMLGAGVACHTLILEDSGEPIAPRVDSFNGVQFEIQRVAGDAYNEVYYATVMEIVGRAYPNTRVISTDAQVVPRGFNYEDAEAVRQLTLNAILPCYTAIETQRQDFQDMDITKLERDFSLNCRIAFNEQQKADYVGLPVRNDISITLSASSAQRTSVNPQQLNVQERTKQIAHVGGFIDPVWAPEQQSQFVYAPNMPQPKFAARFVITNMENVTLTTISSQLLALCTSLVLRENNNWFPYFSPRPLGAGGRQVDIRDVGALNIEGNMSNNASGFDQYVDTKAASFTPQDLGRMLTMLFRPGMFFTLRVSEAGSDNWYNGVFKDAANGNPNAARAILEAADTLTGGLFGKIYQSNENPVIQNVDRVHMGYYVAGDGSKRDIADIDYLAIMNLVGKNDPTVGAAWSDTFFKADQPLHLRLSARRKMIEAAIQTDVHFTGFGRLVTFTNRFIDSLAKACAQAGLDIRTINPAVTGDYFAQRAQVNFLQQAQVMPGQTGVFNQGWGSPQGGFQDYRGFTGRNW